MGLRCFIFGHKYALHRYKPTGTEWEQCMRCRKPLTEYDKETKELVRGALTYQPALPEE